MCKRRKPYWIRRSPAEAECYPADLPSKYSRIWELPCKWRKEMYEELTDREIIALLRVAKDEKDIHRVARMVAELLARGIIKPLKELSEYTTEEKCEKFDILYSYAKDHYNDNKHLGRSHDDSPHYIYEEVMKLLGENVWVNFNFFTM